jgi:hypothetical protein
LRWLRPMVSAAKPTIDKWTQKEWENSWADHPYSRRTTFKLHPKPNKKTLNRFDGLERSESTVLLQAATGKIGLRDHLHRIGRATSRTCRLCGPPAAETVAHILLECPDLAELRDKVLWRNIGPTNDMGKLLGEAGVRAKNTAQFLLQSGLLDQFSAATFDT